MQVGNNALIGDYFQQRINTDFSPGSCLRQIAVLEANHHHYGEKRGLKLRGRIIMVTAFRE